MNLTLPMDQRVISVKEQPQAGEPILRPPLRYTAVFDDFDCTQAFAGSCTSH